MLGYQYLSATNQVGTCWLVARVYWYRLGQEADVARGFSKQTCMGTGTPRCRVSGKLARHRQDRLGELKAYVLSAGWVWGVTRRVSLGSKQGQWSNRWQLD